MTAWDITRKDLRLLRRDRRALAVLVILPLIFISILGLSTGKLMGWKNSNHRLKVGVITTQQSEVADKAIERLSRLSFLEVALLQPSAEPQAVGEGMFAVITMGDQFDSLVDELRPKDILNTRSGRLSDGLDAIDVTLEIPNSGGGSAANLIRYVVTNEVIRSVAPSVLRKVGMFRRIIDAETESAESAVAVQQIGEMTNGDRASSSRIYRELVPSYTVMFVFFLVNIMGRSFIAERELGTLRRLRLAPASPLSIMVGKTLPFLVISLGQTAVLFVCGRLFFGMTWGTQPPLLIPIVFCTSLAATSLGLCFATLVRTDSQVSAYGNMIVLTMAGISGCFMPRDWLPDAMRAISLGTPHAWALMAYHNALGEIVSPAYVMQCCGMLVMFATAFFLIGWWRFGAMKD